MLSINVLVLFASIGAASPRGTQPNDILGLRSIDSDGREFYIVEGNATDAAIWDEPGGVSSRDLEPRQVNYRCWSQGEPRQSNYVEYVRSACEWLQGGYATNQEKRACRNFSPYYKGKYDFAVRNTVGGRGHEYAGCVDRLSAILSTCYYGGRVNRASWEMKADPNSSQCAV